MKVRLDSRCLLVRGFKIGIILPFKMVDVSDAIRSLNLYRWRLGSEQEIRLLRILALIQIQRMEAEKDEQ